MDVLPTSIFVVIFVSLYIASWYFEVVWRGVWKFLAILPITIMCTVPLDIMIGTTIDPTSHNLYPFEFILYVVPSFIFWVIIVLLHGKFAKSDKPKNSAKNEKPWTQPF